jgi:hypothetical protein
MQSDESSVCRPSTASGNRKFPSHKEIRAAISARSRFLDWPGKLAFGRSFESIPTSLILDPLLDDYLRGIFLDGRRERRRLIRRWLLPVSVYYVAGMLVMGKQIKCSRKRLQFLILMAALSFTWQFMTWRKFSLINSQISQSLNWGRDDLAHVKSSNRDALDIVTGYQQSGAPFVLMLRTFDEVREARVTAREAGAELKKLSASEGSVISVRSVRPEFQDEEKLAAALRRWIPVVAIRNPAQVEMSPNHSLPRLALFADEWREPVQHLIELAPYICVHLTELTPGVSFELESIHRLGKEDATLIVIGESQGHGDMVAEFFASMDLPVRKYQAPNLGDVPLRFFRHLVRQTELDLETLASNPEVFAWAGNWMS